MLLPKKNTQATTLLLCHHGIGDVIQYIPFIYNVCKSTQNNIVITVKSNLEKQVLLSSICTLKKATIITRKDIYKLLFMRLNIREAFSIGIAHKKTKLLFKLLGVSKQYFCHPYLYDKPENFPEFDATVFNSNQQHKVEVSKELFETVYKKAFTMPDFPWLNGSSSSLKKKIVIHPGCGKTETKKRWPIRHYNDLISLIIKETNFTIIIVGGPDDLELKDQLSNTSPNVLNKIGDLSLLETTQTIQDATLVLGSDSGLLHIAAALKKNVLCLFGPTDENITAPYGDHVTILNKHVNCGPCYFSKSWDNCENNVCLKLITPKEVLKKIKEI
ncbi:hypothetical protein DID80_05855 [Candidatus Marinamargulisbacteria bacterium SCGC AAA071-K20]|nr:hypothetical protein DID80_05855 [Candidatus Marinamargulisbacteria bacterium SCGC AAA071-K20]